MVLKANANYTFIQINPRSAFKKGNILYLQDGTELEVISYREQKGFGYCKFVGVDTIEKAEALKTKEVFIKNQIF